MISPNAPRGPRGVDYDSLKDRAMAEAAEYGLMLWDGKSPAIRIDAVRCYSIGARATRITP